MTHYFTSTPVVKYVHQKMSTRNRPWKTWKQYAKLNVISKILNVIKAGLDVLWEKEKGKYFIQWAALITNWRIKRGKITCECFTFERELLLENGLTMMKKWLNFFPVSQSRPVSLPKFQMSKNIFEFSSKIFLNFYQFFFYFWTWVKLEKENSCPRAKWTTKVPNMFWLFD